MSFISQLVAIADSVTKSLGLQGDITWEAWTGQSGSGTPTYAAPVTIKAIIDTTRQQRPTATGQVLTVVATLTIIEAVTPNTTVTVPPRVQPIDPRDRITLPDGTSGPIFSGPGSVFDPVEGRPIVNEIMLGEIATQP